MHFTLSLGLLNNIPFEWILSIIKCHVNIYISHHESNRACHHVAISITLDIWNACIGSNVAVTSAVYNIFGDNIMPTAFIVIDHTFYCVFILHFHIKPDRSWDNHHTSLTTKLKQLMDAIIWLIESFDTKAFSE